MALVTLISKAGSSQACQEFNAGAHIKTEIDRNGNIFYVVDGYAGYPNYSDAVNRAMGDSGLFDCSTGTCVCKTLTEALYEITIATTSFFQPVTTIQVTESQLIQLIEDTKDVITRLKLAYQSDPSESRLRSINLQESVLRSYELALIEIQGGVSTVTAEDLAFSILQYSGTIGTGVTTLPSGELVGVTITPEGEATPATQEEIQVAITQQPPAFRLPPELTSLMPIVIIVGAGVAGGYIIGELLKRRGK